MKANAQESAIFDADGLNYDDIPAITDFSKWRKNPHVGKFIKDGKCTIEIEHDGYSEIVEYNVETGEKTVLQLTVKDSRIIVEDKRIAI